MPFNLNTILDKTPYGGFRAGMADQDAIMQSNSGLANDAIHRSKISQDMETTALKRPLDAVEQARKIAQEESDLKDIQAGGRDRDRQAKRDQEQADLAKKLSDNEIQQLGQKLKGMDAVSAVFGDEVDPAKLAMGWETARSHGKEYGFDIGEYNQQNATKFLRMKAASPTAMKLHENAMKEKQKLDADLITKGAQHNYDMDKQIQNQGFLAGESKLNRQTQLDVARTYRSDSGGGESDPKSMGAHTAAIFAKANRFMEHGDPKDAPTEMELQLLENNMARTEAERLMFADPLLKVAIMTRDQDPAAAAKVEAAMPRFMAMTGSGRMVQAIREKASAVRGGGGGRSAPKGMGGGSGSLFSGGGTVTPQPNKAPASSGGFTLRGSRPAGGD